MTNRLMRRLAVSGALAFAVLMIGNASATLITFEGVPTGVMTSFTQGSFTITAVPSGNPGDEPTIVTVGGANVVIDGNNNDPFGSAFIITETDGGFFTLLGIDGANLNNSGPLLPSCGAGVRIELTDNLGDCAVFGPGTSNLLIGALGIDPSEFHNISSLQITLLSEVPFNFAVGNIDLGAASPEPSTVALILAGLAGLGISARRQRTREK